MKNKIMKCLVVLRRHNPTVAIQSCITKLENLYFRCLDGESDIQAELIGTLDDMDSVVDIDLCDELRFIATH